MMQRCQFSDFNLKSDFFLCPDLGTFIDFQPVSDHFAQIYVLFQIFLAELSGISDDDICSTAQAPFTAR